MKFMVDCMLGKLAKWLKILGFDAVFYNKIEDSDLIDAARRERRILLTRDTGIMEKAGDIKTLFIESEEWREQVVQVLDEFDLWKNIYPYSRCLECNNPLKKIPKRKAKNMVSPFVYNHAQRFSICPQCGRIFWQGTHFQDMEIKIANLLKKNKKKRNNSTQNQREN